MARSDARIREMQFLARLDRDGPIEIIGGYEDSPERQMILSLVSDGCLNGIDTRHDASMAPDLSKLEWDRATAIWQLRSNLPHLRRKMEISISHKGRVRLSELGQQLRTGRDRDGTGILWAKRHVMTDIAIEILSASVDTPLSVAFLDMNDLKQINDTHGHDVGDAAIRAFFQTVVSTIGPYGEAYCNGGDEVVILLPAAADEQAHRLLEQLVRQLGKEQLPPVTVRLTTSCGSASTTSPGDGAAQLLKRADVLQYRAKAVSKEHAPRVSTIAMHSGEVQIHDPAQEP